MSVGGTEGTVPTESTVPTGAAPASHRARYAAVVALVVVAGLVAVLATRPPAQATEVYSPLVGHQAPPVSGTTTTGGSFSLTGAPGHYVVLNFFASWCQPCQQEEPELVAFAYEHRATGDARVVSVIFSDSLGAARTFQATVGATWPTLQDPSGAIALAYGVRNPPSTFLIAPDGKVVAFLLSSVTQRDLDALIARAQASGA